LDDRFSVMFKFVALKTICHERTFYEDTLVTEYDVVDNTAFATMQPPTRPCNLCTERYKQRYNID